MGRTVRRSICLIFAKGRPNDLSTDQVNVGGKFEKGGATQFAKLLAKMAFHWRIKFWNRSYSNNRFAHPRGSLWLFEIIVFRPHLYVSLDGLSDEQAITAEYVLDRWSVFNIIWAFQPIKYASIVLPL